MNSLVNLKGKQGHSFETDRLVELLNGMLKEFQSERSIFSKDSDELLEHWALNAPYLSRLKLGVERTFSALNSGAHPIKPMGEDVFSMAQELSRSSIEQRSAEKFSAHRTADLFAEGLSSLGANVAKYNAECAQVITVTPVCADICEDDRPADETPESPTLLAQAFLEGPWDSLGAETAEAVLGSQGRDSDGC
jgi:hypothetical protein